MVAIFEEDIEDDESDFLAHSHKRHRGFRTEPDRPHAAIANSLIYSLVWKGYRLHTLPTHQQLNKRSLFTVNLRTAQLLMPCYR